LEALEVFVIGDDRVGREAAGGLMAGGGVAGRRHRCRGWPVDGSRGRREWTQQRHSEAGGEAGGGRGTTESMW
jgi:hypothetical protein